MLELQDLLEAIDSHQLIGQAGEQNGGENE